MTVTERYPADADLCETEDIVSTTVYKYDGDGNQISNYKKESEWSCHNYLSGHDFENLDAWTAEAVNTVDTILIQSRETDNARNTEIMFFACRHWTKTLRQTGYIRQ